MQVGVSETLAQFQSSENYNVARSTSSVRKLRWNRRAPHKEHEAGAVEKPDWLPAVRRTLRLPRLS